MSELLERVKRDATIQPTDCRCLPEMAKHMMQFALQDKISEEKNKLDRVSEAVRKYPTIAGRVDAGLRENEQYKKGLVKASDVIGWAPSKISIEELKDSISAHEYMVSQIKTIPNCSRT